MVSLLVNILSILVLIGTLPIITLLIQFFLAGFHTIYNHYAKCKPYTPRIGILVPAWNEAEVIGYTIDRLVSMDYPADALRIYLLDDGSTDNTQEVVKSKQALYPNQVVYLKNQKGGLGKAHVLNFGLKHALADSFCEAIMIIDADIIFEEDTLLKLTRHLADPEVGAVTSYIKVGQIPGNFLSHCIAAEYILSQAISRRAQNVTGSLACLAGGTQLHTRENLEAMGGQINTTTLAEDTFTTFLTQLNNRRAIFEGHAVVKAEEPDDLLALWKQRFRWSRGNIQITKAFKHVWFNPKYRSSLGGIFFGMTWFSTMMMPFTMMTTSLSLILLFFLNTKQAWTLFHIFYLLSAVSYVFSVLLSFAIDSITMRRAWFATLMFPGIISLCMIFLSLAPQYFDRFIYIRNSAFTWRDYLLLFMNAWVSLSMFFAWLVYRIAKLKAPKLFINILICIIGYGPILCAITFLAFIAEVRKSNIVWDKTEKTMKIKMQTKSTYAPLSFEQTLTKNIRAEQKLLWDEILIILFMTIALLIVPLLLKYIKA